MANKQFLDKDGVDRLAQGLKALMPTKVSQLENDSGYKTVDTNTTYTFTSGDNNGQIKVTPSGGTAQNVDVKGLGTLAFSSESIPKKVSDIENDKKYITNISEETNNYTFESNGNSLNKNIIYGNSKQETTLGTNIIGLDNTQCKVSLKAGDKIILKNESGQDANVNLYANYGDTTRDDYFTIGNGIARVITLLRDANAISWDRDMGGIAWANLGETLKPYEVYTGGNPSPNPDYPSEIENVGIKNIVKSFTNNTVATKYTYAVYAEVDLKPNTTYTISFIGEKGNYVYINEEIFAEYKNFICTGLRQSITATTKDSFTEKTKYTIFKHKDGNSVVPNFTELMIEEDSIAHDYVPYGNWLVEKITEKNLLKENEKTINSYKAIYKFEKTGDYVLSIVNQIVQSGTTEKFLVGILKNNSLYYSASYNIGSKVEHYINVKSDDIGSYLVIYSSNSYQSSQNVTTKFEKLMLEQGTTATDYEPYQENIVITSLNKENLFNSEIDVYGILTDSGTINPNTQYIITKKIPVKPDTNYILIYDSSDMGSGFRIGEYDQNGNFIKRLNDSTLKRIAFTTPSNIGYINTCYLPEASFDIKLYESYESFDYYELNKIGDVEDEIDLVTGVLTKRIGKVVLDGSEYWQMTYGTGMFNLLQPFQVKDINNRTSISTHFKYNQVNQDIYGQLKDGEFAVQFYNNTSTVIFLKNMSIATVNDFKTWLSNNPVTVYYILEEPEIIKLKPNYLQTYKGTNNIIIDSNIQPSKIEIGYDNAENIGNEVYVGIEEPNSEEAMIWIEPDDFAGMGTEVVNSLEGNETTMAPSVAAIKKEYKKNKYSTDEVIIGEWIDGKPIYRRTYNFGALPNATSKTIPHNLTNIDKFINIYGFSYDSGKTTLPLPFVHNSGGDIQLNCDGLNICVVTKTNRSSFTVCYITIEYTKTTD